MKPKTTEAMSELRDFAKQIKRHIEHHKDGWKIKIVNDEGKIRILTDNDRGL